ncbi:hypothetical protein F2P81_007469 [Scophthalmus maximus]|uniref:Uncharacterized protein n=1 Tax=Scophthalmus maximus TaxID=52904 RepID=A0A6A4T7Q1_SCOMX|nr:hypothetical protein F2P81_007469 [Scophthalmus maximus]
MDELRLRITTHKWIMDCNIMIFTETWLNSSAPDSAIELTWRFVLRADRPDDDSGKRSECEAAVAVDTLELMWVFQNLEADFHYAEGGLHVGRSGEDQVFVLMVGLFPPSLPRRLGCRSCNLLRNRSDIQLEMKHDMDMDKRGYGGDYVPCEYSPIRTLIFQQSQFFSVPVHLDRQFWFAFSFDDKAYTWTSCLMGYKKAQVYFTTTRQAILQAAAFQERPGPRQRQEAILKIKDGSEYRVFNHPSEVEDFLNS